MQFKHRLERDGPCLVLAPVADARQLITELDAVAVLARIGIVRREHPGIDARAQHGGCKARTFLIGPVGDHHRRVGFITHVNQSTHGLQRAKHAQHAVKFAACRLRIEMRAHGNGRHILALARARGKHVADLVDLDRAAELFAFRLEPVAHPLVFVRDGEALDAALGCGTEGCGLHQRVPQALRIDGEIGLGRHG